VAYIGVDIGGTSSKVACMSKIPLKILQGTRQEVTVKGKNYYLYAYSNSDSQPYWSFL
jgi:sugar (pentulose or hexulose) kinase